MEIFKIVTNGINVKSEEDALESDCNRHLSFPSRYLHHATRSDAYSARLKGVVPQSNGHWGAQIYANHQRIWLGTFKSEKEAGMAYASAALKLRSGDQHRNFPWTGLTIQEHIFQTHHTTEAVLDMIKEGSYPSKFADFLRSCTWKEGKDIGLHLMKVEENGGMMLRLLFEKELTPSDVGKLNRLVIPKKYAVKFFPPLLVRLVSQGVSTEGRAVHDAELSFHDRLMRTWKFRYCYWNSSQSYVFTRGWNRFVKDKKLNSKDNLVFYLCRHRERENVFCMIDVRYDGSERNGNAGQPENTKLELKLELGSGQNENYHKRKVEEPLGSKAPTHAQKKDRVMLFGVDIN